MEGHKDKPGHDWVALGVSRNSEIGDRTKLGLVKDKRELEEVAMLCMKLPKRA